MIHIESDFPFPEELLERAAHAALEHEAESQEAELSIVLTDNEHLQELNLNYLGIDAPTDVLSFPASETDPESGRIYRRHSHLDPSRPKPGGRRRSSARVGGAAAGGARRTAFAGTRPCRPRGEDPHVEGTIRDFGFAWTSEVSRSVRSRARSWSRTTD